MMKFTFRVLSISFLIISLTASAKAQSADSLVNEFRSLSNDTLKISKSESLLSKISQLDPDTALALSIELHDHVLRVVPPRFIAEAKLNVGRVFIRKGGYEKSLEYLTEANNIDFSFEDHPILKGEILRNIGNIYFIQYRPVESMEYYREALKYFVLSGSELRKADLYGSIANIHYESFLFDSSLYYNLKALEIRKEFGSEMSVGRSYLNTGMLYDAMELPEKAIEYSLKALDIAERNNANIMKTYPLKVLSSVYRKKGELESALKYAEESLRLSEEMNIIYEMKDAHANLASTNYELGNFKEAYDHLREQKALNDSLLNEDANVRLAEMRALYETEKAAQENEILASKNALQRTRYIALVSTLAFSLILVTFFYSRNVSKKSRALEMAKKDRLISDSKRKLAEEELANSELRSKHLQDELTNYAFHIVEKNNFLEEIKSEMAEVRNEIKSDEALKHINKLGSKIYQNLMINKDREEFDIQVEQACEGFFQKLDEKYPNLTNQERRLSALLRLNLSSKEISGILNISPKSVDQTRYRLRKKLEINKNENLTAILNSL
jgi:tetratricopeptide (TPR) repeat protein